MLIELTNVNGTPITMDAGKFLMVLPFFATPAQEAWSTARTMIVLDVPPIPQGGTGVACREPVRENYETVVELWRAALAGPPVLTSAWLERNRE